MRQLKTNFPAQYVIVTGAEDRNFTIRKHRVTSQINKKAHK